MKLIDSYITETNKDNIEDQIDVRNINPSNLNTNVQLVSQVPKIPSKVLNFSLSHRTFHKNKYSGPEYDLSEVGIAEDVDSFIRQSFKKKLGLMFKEGFSFSGANKNTIKYIKNRKAQIARATNIPTIELIKRIASSLTRVSNAYLIKVRDKRASGGRVRTTADGKKLEPIAGYFPAAPETMRVELDSQSGQIIEWKQVLPDGRFRIFNKDDVVHFVIDRREGFFFGIPTIVPVLDDIRALRHIEENVEMLLYQYLFPLFHYRVGTETAPASFLEDGTKEIDAVKAQIEMMPPEGVLVTPERHEIHAIGAEGRSVRAEGYLDHFKKRVFAGLGVSQVDMGESDTCYSEDTQVLTDSGWKFEQEVTDKDKIATYNSNDNSIEYQHFTDRYISYRTGDMIHFYTEKHVDILVTPNHDMWVKSRFSKNNWRKIKAKDLVKDSKWKEFHILEATNGFNVDNKNVPKFINRDNLEDWCRFLGYFISEGCLDKSNASNSRYRVLLSQSPGKCLEDMKRVCKNLGFSFSEKYENNPNRINQLVLYGKDLYKWIEHHISHGSNNKRIPFELYNYDKFYIRSFLEAVIAGDGTNHKNNSNRTRTKAGFTYYTSSIGLADDILSLGILAGFKTKISKPIYGTEKNPNTIFYRISLTEGANTRILNIDKGHVKIIPYKGKVWCFTVPNSLFITRRNGKIAIQGNSNRATAVTLSRQLIDSVKDIQDAIEAQWDHLIISELLLESTFGNKVLEEENMVHLSFHEIDIQNKMEQQQHSLEMFKGNAITYDELRSELGKEPIPIPDDPENQDPQQWPEWFNTHWKLFEEPLNIIRAVDEPFTAASQAAAELRTLSLQQKQLTAEQKAKEQQQKTEAEQDKQTKIAVAKVSSRNKKDNFFSKSFEDFEYDTSIRLINNLKTNKSIQSEQLLSMARVWSTDISDKLSAIAYRELLRGFRDYIGFDNNSPYYEFIINIGRKDIKNRIHFLIDKLVKDVIRLLTHRVDSIDDNVKLAGDYTNILDEIHSVFDSIRFRTDFIWDVEIKKSYNYGLVLGIRFLNQLGFVIKADELSCKRCRASDGKFILASDVTLDSIPPFHANSRMTIDVIKDNDNFKELESISSLDDQTKLESCVLSVKRDLRKRNPNMSEEDIKSRAFAICNSRIKRDSKEVL